MVVMRIKRLRAAHYLLRTWGAACCAPYTNVTTPWFVLLISESGHWIDVSGAARRDVAGDERRQQ